MHRATPIPKPWAGNEEQPMRMDGGNINLLNIIPSVGWLRRYQKAWVRPDIIAGLTAAAVVIPKAMAYATIAGLPVQVGLYTVFVPMVVYALLGTSRPLSVSTTTTIAILAAAQLARQRRTAGSRS
jgi:MFS superfamily sulfate permease-like transporter